jgi:hypothetical protein
VGNVSDSSGGTVPGATVTATQTETNLRRESVTNESGTAPNVDMSLFRVFRIGQNKTLQVRAEVFNVSNTAHFTNPNAVISNVTFRADGTIQALNGVGGISATDRTGRQYDEREWRFGARFGF